MSTRITNVSSSPSSSATAPTQAGSSSPTAKDTTIFSDQLGKAQAKTNKPVGAQTAVAGKSPKAPIKSIQQAQTDSAAAMEESEAEPADKTPKNQVPATDQSPVPISGKSKSAGHTGHAQAKQTANSQSQYQLPDATAAVGDPSDRPSSGQRSKDEKSKPSDPAPGPATVDATTRVVTGTPSLATVGHAASAADQSDSAPKIAMRAGKPSVAAIKPSAKAGAAKVSQDADQADASAAADVKDHAVARGEPEAPTISPTVLEAPTPAPAAATHALPVAAAPAAAPTPDAPFAQANHPPIVMAIHGQLLPKGGTMSIHLDPPQLGAMQITVKVEGGMVSASFETSNEEATRLLSHTLGQLKGALQLQGVGVERLHVRQTSPAQDRDDAGGSGRDRNSGANPQSAQQEQQRREMLRRMWRRAGYGRDSLDMVA